MATSARLQLYIQVCIMVNEPIDWYYVRSQCKNVQETDRLCADYISKLNLTVEKNGEDYTPKGLEV
jgi:hypothetical protein